MLEVSLSDFMKVKKFPTEAQEGPLMKPVVLQLKLEKSTKGTHVYKNEEEKIYGFYIPKQHFDGELPPQFVKVTIEAWKEEA